MAAPTPIPESRHRHTHSLSAATSPGTFAAFRAACSPCSDPGFPRDEAFSLGSSFTGMLRRMSTTGRNSLAPPSEELLSTSATSTTSLEPATPREERPLSRFAQHLDACDADGTWPYIEYTKPPRSPPQPQKNAAISMKRQPSLHGERLLMGHLEA